MTSSSPSSAPRNFNYPPPSYSSLGSYTRPDLGSPSSFNPYPSFSVPSYPGSLSGSTTSFPTSGLSQPAFFSHSSLSGLILTHKSKV